MSCTGGTRPGFIRDSLTARVLSVRCASLCPGRRPVSFVPLSRNHPATRALHTMKVNSRHHRRSQTRPTQDRNLGICIADRKFRRRRLPTRAIGHGQDLTRQTGSSAPFLCFPLPVMLMGGYSNRATDMLYQRTIQVFLNASFV